MCDVERRRLTSWRGVIAIVQVWTQFRCIAERSRYLVAARRLMAALERSEERRIESSDLERLMPGLLRPAAAMEAQHRSSYMMRRALAPLELRPPRTSSLRSPLSPTAPCVDGGVSVRSITIRAQLEESVECDGVQTVCPGPVNGCYCWHVKRRRSLQFTAQG
ncbi:hypothetical protein Q7P36_001669 [Cladosporium allicinum]